MPKNPNWTSDEIILALDLYFRLDPFPSTEQHPEILALSELLNRLPIHTYREQNFRNPDGVYMKLCNFLHLDPEYPGVGLYAGSKLDQAVWDYYAPQRDLLKATAEAIRRNSGDANTLTMIGVLENLESEEFFEGRILEIMHKFRERDSTLARKKKEQVLAETGSLACEVCGFDFATRYGVLGEGFAECHHKTPISQLRPNTKTRLEDLAVVCANCHRMIHRRGAPPTFEEFIGYWRNLNRALN